MTTLAAGNTALDVGDPRRPSAALADGPDRNVSVAYSTGHKLHDKNVSFEEYLFYAKLSRSDQRYEDPDHSFRVFGKTLIKGRYHGNPAEEAGKANALDGKMEKGGADSPPQPFIISDEEYVQASRAVRTASWGAVFFLITTDILGPFATPWAFAAVSSPSPPPPAARLSCFRVLTIPPPLCRWAMGPASSSSPYSASRPHMAASSSGGCSSASTRTDTLSGPMATSHSVSTASPRTTSSMLCNPSNCSSMSASS
jgi:hypothetical protein